MDVFGAIVASSRGFMRDAAVGAAAALGVFGALPGTAEEVARRLDLPNPRRLRPLLDVLALEGITAPPARLPSLPRQGWGLLAEVIRRDRPLPEEGAQLAAFHEHLRTAGEGPARELMEALRARSVQGPLLDLGGGTGAYTRAFLEVIGGAATLLDREPVLELARRSSGDARAGAPWPAQVTLLPGDLLNGDLPGGQGLVLLANVLHLYGPHDCARIVERARRAGAVLAVKDLDAASVSGTYFALNMALFTEAGDVHPLASLRSWIGPCEEVRLASAPDAVTLIARGVPEP